MKVMMPTIRISVSFVEFITFYGILIGFLSELLLPNIYNVVKSSGTNTCNVLVYTSTELVAIYRNSNMFTFRPNEKLKNKLESLGIKRRYRGHRSKIRKHRNWDYNIGVHKNLLRPLRKVLMDYSENKNLTFAIVNTQSICNKVDEFLHHVTESNLDICCVTETWLDDKNPKHSIIRSSLTLPGYSFIDIPRSSKHGGGTGIKFKNKLKVKIIDSSEQRSFEYSAYEVMYRAISFHILVVYRPPYSTSHPVTSSVFFEEFSAFIEQFLNEHQSVLICGDFNIPCNKPEDLDSIALDELCDNMGLDQLVKCQTHKFGNTLDLIMVPRDGKLIYSEPEEKFQISDHSFIHVCISMPKPKVVRDLRKFRDIKNINSVDFTRDLGQFNTDSAKLENIDEFQSFIIVNF